MTKSSYSSKPTRRKGINWAIWAPILGVIITAMAGIIVAIVNNWLPPISRPTPTPAITRTVALPPQLKIRSLQEKQVVTLRLDSVDGTFDHVADDRQIWLTVKANNLCYPQEGPAEKLPAGIWRHGPVQFSGSGEQQVLAVLVTAEVAGELRSASGIGKPGVVCDRPGVQVLDSVVVMVSPNTPVAGMKTPDAPSAPAVEFEEPRDQQLVKGHLIFAPRGKYSGIGKDDELWLVVFVSANFFIQNGPAVLTPPNIWIHGDIFLGEEGKLAKPTLFTIIPVVVTNSQDKAWFRGQKSGQPAQELPKGVTLLTSIAVTRTE